MGTRGFFAYLYQKRYYRQYIHSDSYPSGLGWDVARSIPHDPARLQAWIVATIRMLERDKEYRLEYKQEDHDESADFTDVCDDRDWTLPDGHIEWTYVIDLDNRLFIVNGLVHFRLDNMPPTRSRHSGFVAYFENNLPIPPEYLATSSLWPDPDFDTEEAQKQYDAMQPIIIPLVEWGAPTWETLSVSQHLSACLVRTLVQDSSVELALPYFPRIQNQLGVFCWQLTCAAAPSNLICPPIDVAPTDGLLDVGASSSGGCQGWYYLKRQGFRNRFVWFRGCLIMFCLRLDESAYMMHEVQRMVVALRKHENGSRIGIIISNWHMVAVSVDGSEVRHSPVLDLHDGKDELRDGVLLLMHLLRPLLTGTKAPWQDTSLTQVNHNSSSALPEDIIRHIVYFADYETYLGLPLVSRLVRSICLANPRIGDHTLLSKDPGSKYAFKICSTSSSSTTLATLTRTEAAKDPNEGRARQLWNYDSRYHTSSFLKPGLAGMFQHHQIGGGSPADLPEAAAKWLKKAAEWQKARKASVGLLWENIVRGEKYPEMRIQALDGVWQMVEAGLEAIDPE